MEDDQIQVKVDATTDENGEVVIRHGAALPLQEPKAIRLSGQIYAPSEFYEKRKHLFNQSPLMLAPAKESELHELQENVPGELITGFYGGIITYHSDTSYITFDKTNGVAFLVIDENNPYRIEVKGSLVENPLINDLHLNQETYFEPKDLAKKLRKWRHFAESFLEFDEVIKNLMNFKGSFTTEFDKSNDKKGNIANSIVRKLTSEHKLDFTLEFPIFKDTPVCKLNFFAEIDYTDKGVLICTLYVPDLESTKESVKEDVFDQLNTAFTDIAIVNI